MAKFKFRLDKLLEYRRLQEKWAKDTYLATVARRVETEGEIEGIARRKTLAATSRPCALDGLVSLDCYLTRLDDEQRGQEAALAVIEGEVETALKAWNEARQAAEAIGKLRESELVAWNVEQNRKEQGELDEWSVFRRAA